MSRMPSHGRINGPVMAILIGLAGGLGLLALVHFDIGLGGPKIDRSGRLAILINGVPQRMARDVLLPESGWVLQIRLPEDGSGNEGLITTLRSERTGAMIRIDDRFAYEDGFATLVIPRSLGLAAGLLSVRAMYEDADGRRYEDSRRIRIRPWLGGPPIGTRQVIQFDFDIDREDDGVPDFHRDLERFGLASPRTPELTRIVADRIAARALARVEAAYDPEDDPNRTGRPSDRVTVRFRTDPDPSPAAMTTRICVGGADPTESASVGHVRFDLRNQQRFSTECGSEPAAGLFPAELETYREDPLFRKTFGPFLVDEGGVAIGGNPADALVLSDAPARESGTASRAMARRRAQIERAISVFGDVLGSIMAHEAGHALGLVAEGRPAVGLFGGHEGDFYAHNLDAFGHPETEPWLMNAGKTLRFTDLAGEGPNGPLRFRPLNYAYLRDRVVVSDRH